MRVAYIAPYQGPTVVKRRPIVRNVNNGGNIKIELIASLLRARGHEVDVISQGEVIEPRCKLYHGFPEPERFHPEISVSYASVLPVRRVNGLWSSASTVRLVKSQHRATPYDVVVIYNMKPPQIAVARYALRSLKLPVILEYEDDVFVNVEGEQAGGLVANYHRSSYRGLMETVCGCVAVSPHLLSQAPSQIPKLLLPGVVGDDIVAASQRPQTSRKNWVLFSGTHIDSSGVAQLIEAWPLANLTDWELHITGRGGLTNQLRHAAKNQRDIIFHGFVKRPELVELMSSARIGINPHAVSRTPGNVFAFKIIEYLGAGVHVITTPMGDMEPEIESGITLMPNNEPKTIAAALRRVVDERRYEQSARQAAIDAYGSRAVSLALDKLLRQVIHARNHAVTRS